MIPGLLMGYRWDGVIGEQDPKATVNTEISAGLVEEVTD